MDVVIRVCVFQQFTELHIIILSYTMCLCDSVQNNKILVIKVVQVYPFFLFTFRLKGLMSLFQWK